MSAPATVADRIRALMADGKPRTTMQICEAIQADSRRVNKFLEKAREPGDAQEFRALDRLGNSKSVRHVIGKGRNVADPRAAGAKTRMALHRARVRTPRDGWPAADAAVLRSMDAMVRMGSSHANR